MAESWQLINDSERLEAGQTYRLRLMIRAPYNALTTGALNAAFRLNAAIRGIDIVRIDHAAPGVTDSGLISAHAFDQPQAPPFPYIVRFKPRAQPDIVQAGLDPRAIWALTALVVTTIAALAITSKKLERLITTAGSQLNTNLRTVLNPGLVVLVFVGLVLFHARR